ncbi:Protein gir2 [Friedmanniomyces endolithicus]|uniref:Protein gir2 n=1 Tax=Friedmanniomyces endolithicus TaxID=329885 RepID=A0AAN6JBG9_9PEZI|nr:Protein gir2 [Friedmanniomyces endolithicus]
MGREEQAEEREVLDSIFPDEIQDVSASEYRVSIALDMQKPDEDETPDPVILLNIRYPEAYPDEAPRLDITQPPNAPRYDHLDIQNDKARLLEALAPTIEESMGMAMVFALVSALKDAAELLVSERLGAIQAVKDVESAKAEEEENRKFEGEKVTRESFLAWREGFQREMAEEAARRVAEVEAEEKKKRGAREERKLTGKQLWQRGLAGNTVEEEDEDEGDDALEGVQRLKVDG